MISALDLDRIRAKTQRLSGEKSRVLVFDMDKSGSPQMDQVSR
jgi:hypothetical protein